MMDDLVATLAALTISSVATVAVNASGFATRSGGAPKRKRSVVDLTNEDVVDLTTDEDRANGVEVAVHFSNGDTGTGEGHDETEQELDDQIVNDPENPLVHTDFSYVITPDGWTRPDVTWRVRFMYTPEEEEPEYADFVFFRSAPVSAIAFTGGDDVYIFYEPQNSPDWTLYIDSTLKLLGSIVGVPCYGEVRVNDERRGENYVCLELGDGNESFKEAMRRVFAAAFRRDRAAKLIVRSMRARRDSRRLALAQMIDRHLLGKMKARWWHPTRGKLERRRREFIYGPPVIQAHHEPDEEGPSTSAGPEITYDILYPLNERVERGVKESELLARSQEMRDAHRVYWEKLRRQGGASPSRIVGGRRSRAFARVHILPHNLNFRFVGKRPWMRVRSAPDSNAGEYIVTFIDRYRTKSKALSVCFDAPLVLRSTSVTIGPILRGIPLEDWRALRRDEQIASIDEWNDRGAVERAFEGDDVGDSTFMRPDGRVIACMTPARRPGAPVFISLVRVSKSTPHDAPLISPVAASLQIRGSRVLDSAHMLGVASSGDTYDIFMADDAHVFILRVPAHGIPVDGVVDLQVAPVEYECESGSGERGEDVCQVWTIPHDGRDVGSSTPRMRSMN